MADPWMSGAMAQAGDTSPSESPSQPISAVSDAYIATGGKIADHAVQFIWLVTSEKDRQVIIPVADIHRMVPPAGTVNETAYIHLSRMTVVLHGSNLHRVLFEIQMGRCSSIHEIKPGQSIPSSWHPVVSKIDYIHTA